MTQPEELDERAQRARAAREGLVGKTIAGRYVIRGLLGHGGMGAVYEAEHVGLGKRAAIKFVDPEFATDEKVVARFAREARAMSAIESAHIVTVFDAGTEDGRPYLVMELLRGEDLGERLRRLRRVPLGEAMHIIAQVLKGLARAHAAGIVHRDLKPDNVFLVKHDTDPLFAKIVDFGISKIERPRDKTSPLALTGRGTVLGTPFYMSPEQAQASPDVDGRTDLYSVGAILFECLTGRPPHTGESYEQIILSICMRDAPQVRSFDPSIPVKVSEFVARALAREREQRFSSAERMLAALHEVAPEERARVPLDPVAPETMLSPGMSATILDGGAAEGRASRPSAPEFLGAATRLGVGALGAEGHAVPLDGESAPNAYADTRSDAKPKVGANANANAKDGAKDGAKKAEATKAKPDAKGARGVHAAAQTPEPVGGKRVSGAARASSPSKAGGKPIGTALLTAAFATLTGVGVTFAVISMLEKKTVPAPPAVATMTASASASPSASAARPDGPRGSVETTTSTAIIASGAPSGAAVPSGSPSGSATGAASLSTASAKPGTPSTVRAHGAGGTLPALPRPSSTKPLDIQRDLP